MQAIAVDQTVGPGSSTIKTVTRLVKLTGDLEQSLQSAITVNDQSRIEKLLADNFEMWVGPRPDFPIPRADWIKQSTGHPELTANRTIEQMAVHDFGEIAIANFKWGGTPDLFVIDVWKLSQGNWKLVTRYASPTGPIDQVIPGSDQQNTQLEKKY